MRRSLVSVLAALALVLALAGSASAVKPLRGCADDFQQRSILEFRAFLNSQDFYDSLSPEGQALAPDLLAQINTQAWVEAGSHYDKNGDGDLCLKQNPPTKGNLYGWVFNAVDNTSNH